MKNITTFIALAMLSTMSTAVFTSCSNADVEPLTIHGTWVHDDTRDNDLDYITFNADGTGAKWETLKATPNGDRLDYEDFTYSLSGNKITIVERDGDIDTETVKVVNNDRIKLDGDIYDRQR